MKKEINGCTDRWIKSRQTSDLLMQTETCNSWGACLKHSKAKSKSFTRGRHDPRR